MALTIAKPTGYNAVDYVSGNKKIKYRTITFDSSYATGGESLVASDVGLKRILDVSGANLAVSSTNAYLIGWDRTNNKLQAFTATTSPTSAVALIEANSTKDLSTFSVTLRFEGY